MNRSRKASRGVGLLDALIAMAILAFGLLALTRFQGRMMAQTTETQSRSVARQLADELMSLALVDPANVACYTLPAAGACANPTARAMTTDWATRATGGRLPGAVTATSTLAGTRLTVMLNWTGRDTTEAADVPAPPRTLMAVTDVQ
jgi:Tfp pilus assembly protein PilV